MKEGEIGEGERRETLRERERERERERGQMGTGGEEQSREMRRCIIKHKLNVLQVCYDIQVMGFEVGKQNMLCHEFQSEYSQ